MQNRNGSDIVELTLALVTSNNPSVVMQDIRSRHGDRTAEDVKRAYDTFKEYVTQQSRTISDLLEITSTLKNEEYNDPAREMQEGRNRIFSYLFQATDNPQKQNAASEEVSNDINPAKCKM